ncbi:hypothetical protein NE237_006745 [Protea cynaroides]|uniref:Uncharacterized protein n=1 Tax=Protea cynaroides TaxID=273540 RepID=A0A9Q0KN36_9MAGN|nr:hypothetical protein NE237_006745 [Protea cynaroides]
MKAVCVFIGQYTIILHLGHDGFNVSQGTGLHLPFKKRIVNCAIFFWFVLKKIKLPRLATKSATLHLSRSGLLDWNRKGYWGSRLLAWRCCDSTNSRIDLRDEPSKTHREPSILMTNC